MLCKFFSKREHYHILLPLLLIYFIQQNPKGLNMINNLSSTAINMIGNAQHKAADAAHQIATLPVAKNEIGSKDYSSKSLIKPVLSLKEAELETSAAVKILKTEEKMLGALFDEKA